MGRSNRALFYGVDRIVYVEGGRDDKGPVEAFDGLFWKHIFNIFCPSLKVKILPRGGKESVLEFAEALNEDSRNVIVAVDRDYDGILGKMIDNPNVLYTFGYSFENDIFSREVLVDLFCNICPICDNVEDVDQAIRDLIAQYCKDVWWSQLADVCGKLVGRKVIDRRQIQKYIASSSITVKPKIAKSVLAGEVYRANYGSSRPRLTMVPYKMENLPDLSVGHLYASFCFKVLAYLHNIYSNTQKLTKDAVTSLAITTFVIYLSNNPRSKKAEYYQEALSRC